MIRTVLLCASLAAAPLPTAALVTDGTRPAAFTAAEVTPEEAAPFLGEWVLAMEAPFEVSLRAESGKVVGEISGGAHDAQKFTDISKSDKGLALSYTFDYEGNPVHTVVTLTPAADGKMNAQIDFAGGAYLMTGTATRKEPAK